MRTDPLNAAYPVRIRKIMIGVLCSMAVLMWAYPRFLDEPDKAVWTGISIPPEFVVEIPATIQEFEPDEPSRPVVPIPSDDEFLDKDLTIEYPEWDELDEWIEHMPPPPENESRFVFIPHEVAPSPKTPIRPEYPELALEAGIEGTVVVDFFVDKTGTVSEIYIAQGIPNTGLDEAAMDAVSRAKWKPAVQQDKKVGVWMRLPIVFTLNTD